MARIEKWYKQDLKKSVPIRRMETVFNQDALGHLFGVEVYSDGEAVTLGGSVTGYCLLADGTTVPVSGTRSSNKASIVIPQTAYSVIGPITITVKLTEGSAITTLLAVVGIVARSRTGQQVDPGSTITDWTNQISAQLQAVQTAADNLGATLATPFSDLTAYSAGTYVVYNGNTYRYDTDHAAGAWNSSQVTQVKVCDEISNLSRALNANTKIDNSVLSVVLKQETNIPLIWENGFIDGSTGKDIARTKNRRAIGYIPTYNIVIKVRSTLAGVTPYIFEYDEDFGFLEAHGVGTSYKSPVNSATKYVRVATFSETIPQADQEQYIEAIWENEDSLEAELRNKPYSYSRYFINNAGKVVRTSIEKSSMLVRVKPGQKLRLRGAVSNNSTIAFLKKWDYKEVTASFCDGYSGRIENVHGNYEYVLNIPADCNYLYVFVQSDYIPQTVIVDNYDYINNKQVDEPNYITFPIAGLKLQGTNLTTSAMQKPSLAAECLLTMVCPLDYKMQITHISTDLQRSALTAEYSVFNGNAPGLNPSYPNYQVTVKKADGTAMSASDIDTVNGLIQSGAMYINTNYRTAKISVSQRIAPYAASIRSAMIKTNSQTIPEQKGDNASPLFVHFSDVHADSERLSRLLTYANVIGATGIINTGDTVLENASNSALFAKDMNEKYNSAVPVYVVVGNHDAGMLYSYADIYSMNVQYYAEKYGYDDTAKPYYYVDLATWKIRLIAVCQYATHSAVPDFDQDQLDWLVSTLQGVPNGYGVVMLSHAPYKWPDGGIIADFTQTDALGYPYYGAYYVLGNLILPIVAAFMNRTSVTVSQTINNVELSATADFSGVQTDAEFICHLHGHTHRDVVGYYLQDGTKQLTIGVDCATAHLGDANSYTYSFCSELARTFNTEQQDLFNLIGFDRVRKYVKVCRVGASLGINMRTRNPIIAQYYFSE